MDKQWSLNNLYSDFGNSDFNKDQEKLTQKFL